MSSPSDGSVLDDGVEVVLDNVIVAGRLVEFSIQRGHLPGRLD